MRAPLVLILCLITLPAAGHAQTCGLSGAALAEKIEGQWLLEVVAAKLVTESSERDLTPGDSEPVVLTLGDDGIGTLQIKKATLDLQAHPEGSANMSSIAEYSAAFKVAVDRLGEPAQHALQDCGLTFLPLLSATLNTDGPQEGAGNTVEIVLLDNGLVAGTQVAHLTSEMLNQKSAPDVTIISSIVMRRMSDGAKE